MNIQYSDKVLDHFMNPRNVGKIDNADVSATEGSPACGDQVTVYLNIDAQSQVISDIMFQSYGCASNIATGSIITEMAKGKTLADAKKITWKAAANELDGLPPAKMHCSVLAVDTLRKAIKNYEIEKGLRTADEFNKATIVEELKKIIHPGLGEDIVSLKLVKYVAFKDGIATIDIDLKADDQFKDNIRAEVHEHLETYEEIKEIKLTI